MIIFNTLCTATTLASAPITGEHHFFCCFRDVTTLRQAKDTCAEQDKYEYKFFH